MKTTRHLANRHFRFCGLGWLALLDIPGRKGKLSAAGAFICVVVFRDSGGEYEMSLTFSLQLV